MSPRRAKVLLFELLRGLRGVVEVRLAKRALVVVGTTDLDAAVVPATFRGFEVKVKTKRRRRR